MKITLPLSIVIPRKTKADKVFTLNLNTFRNAHHMVMNQAKIIWKDVVRDALSKSCGEMPPPPYLFYYKIFAGNGRSFDVGNIAPAIQKFTDDALQELGVIKNDNYKYIPENRHRFSGIDKENPRCELEITTDKTLCNVRTLEGD